MTDFTKFCAILAATFAITACEVEKTQDGDMPEVGVEGGQMPEYEVTKTQEGEMPDVDIEGGEMPEYEVKGPDVEIGSETREVTVPTVDIDIPDDEPDADVKESGISAAETD